ncbi:hypothetical protein J4410_03485 [Candidatus Woesearchaeota archaeon]|nr:hypothetical protein [Candidatus Woesearchaeota archaeon]
MKTISNAVLITLPGMEDIACQELREQTGIAGKAFPSFVLFSAQKEQLYTLAYTSQSARTLGIVLSLIEHQQEDPEQLIKKIMKQLNEELLKKEITETFHVQCLKEGYSSDLSSPDIASELAQHLIQLTGQKTTFQDYHFELLLFLTKTHAVLLLDFSGFDLSKRDYKIFTGSYALRAPLAYALVRLSGFDDTKKLLDPLCGAGIMPIEAAFFATRKPIHFFEKKKFLFFNDQTFSLLEKKDKEEKRPSSVIWCIGDSFHHLTWSKKNAKIGGISDALSYSRTEVNFLDAKFEGNTFDCIVSYPPSLSRNANEKKIKKLYHELFDEAAFLLKKEGRMALLVRQEKEFLEEAERVKLSLKEKRKVSQGKEELIILVFEK